MAGCAQTPPAADNSPPTSTSFKISADKHSPRPYLDVLSATIEETPSTLEVTLELAKYDPKTIAAEMTAAGYQWGSVGVCWNPDPERTGTRLFGQECAYVDLRPTGAPPVAAYSLSYKPPACNDWWWCDWHVPMEATPGTPGTVRIHVPRELSPNATKGGILDGAFVESIAMKVDPSAPTSTLPRNARFFACVPVRCQTYATVAPRLEVVQSATAAPYTLQTELEGTLGKPSPATILMGAPRDVSAGAQGYRADLDILSVDIEETPTEVAYLVKVANLASTPTHNFDMEIGVGGIVYESWYDAYAGQLQEAGGGYCADADCNVWKETTVSVKFTPGTPGTIRAAMKWSEMAQPKKGDLITLAEAELFESNAYRNLRPAPGVSVYASSYGVGDNYYHAEPYYLRLGAPT